MPRVAVVILAYGPEPHLAAAIDSVLASRGVEVELCLVDNGSSSEALERARSRPGVTVIALGANRGFTGGCNAGVAQTTAPLVALVNSDAELEPDALAALAEWALRPDVGIVGACVRLAANPDRVNSAGNPVHFLGLSWAGALGDLAADHTQVAEVASASGACLLLRRTVWEALGGLPEPFFAYLEDAELSLRCWQQGLRVLYVPHAVARHHYEFDRNPHKLHLLERNRAALVLTVWPTATLLAVAPALLALEAVMAAVALAQGWGPLKVAGWVWVWRHRRWIRARRRAVQSERRQPTRDFNALLAGRLDQRALPLPPGFAALDALLAVCWRAVRALLGAGRQAPTAREGVAA